MKLCYFSNSLLPSNRANAVHVMKMAAALSLGVKDFTLFAFSRNPKDQESLHRRYNTPRFEMRLKRYLPIPGYLSIYSRLAAREIRAIGPDIAYSRYLFGSYLLHRKGLPIFTELHTDLWNKDADHKKWFDELVASPNAHGFITISQVLKDDLLADYPQLSDEMVFVAHDAADFQQTNEPDSNPLEQWRDRPQVGYTGSLQKGKGSNMLIQLANRPEFRQVMFHVVGGKAEQIQECRQKVSQENVVFHGQVDHSRIPSFIRAFDICLLPNEPIITTGKRARNIAKYTSPLKLFEYMAQGKAILSSDMEVLREVLGPRNSRLVEALNEEAWANQLRELLGDSDLRIQIGNAAKQDFSQKYTWKKRAEHITHWCRSRVST